ncbi:MAG TPA: hypothetical protein VF952_11485 [Chloroflexia bacterium]
MDNFLNGLTLLGIPAVVIVPLLVQGLKALGLPGRWAGVAALMVGLAVAGMIEAVSVWPGVTPVVRFIVAGLLLGLASSGSYSQFRSING